ncbi:MAG: Na-translocating system protein MpsB, partial [Gemmatimonadota bacterium]|nr:Na-translocating system protein MpsB [Gemmatimonadota bacterium]
MTTDPSATTTAPADKRERLAHELEHWGHLLPSQGPMTTIVHHNTLHGLQHQPFEQAVAEGERLLGGRAYEPVERGRARYQAGRITDADLEAAFAARAEFGPAEVLGTVGGRTVTDAEVRRLH